MNRSDQGLRFHGDTVAGPGQLDFAVNLAPGGPPGWLQEALRDGLSRAAAYPDQGPATTAVAARHRRPPEEVVLLNGSAEAFWLLAQVLQPNLAVVVHPSFTEPEAALQAAGHRVRRVWRDPDHFHLDPDMVPAEADLVVTGNPNNPTGTLDPAAALAALARPGRVLVVDEAFMEFTGEAESLAGRRDLPGLVVVRSLTKLWGLAGIRAGSLLASSRPRARCGPPASHGASIAWPAPPWPPGPSKPPTTPPTKSSAWPPSVSDSPPPWRRCPGSGSGRRLPISYCCKSRTDRLCSPAWPPRGIAVRPCHSFPGLTVNHLRVAVRDPADNQRLIGAFHATLGR
jgi:histidinol-phosphate aminotransferase